MPIGELVFAVFCASWWGLTLYVNVAPSARLRRLDVLSLVPTYHFFAPVPRGIDRLLEYRLQFADGEPGAWQQVEFPRPRTWSSMWWNPHDLGPLVVAEWTVRLQQALARNKGRPPVDSLVYQEALACLQQLPDVAAADAMQFQFRTGRVHDPEALPVVLFRSEWRGLNP